MARKAKNSVSAPDLLSGVATTQLQNKKPADGAKTAPPAFVVFNAADGKPVIPKPDTNGIIFDEYGIDGKSKDIPAILKAILCELVRRRVTQ